MKNKMNNNEKIFYTIGEVSEIIGVQPYVLRNWEKEIGFLKPKKKDTGHRIYSKNDVEIAKRIKELLYEEHYTIPGARKRLWYELRRKELPPIYVLISRVRKELNEILNILTENKKSLDK